jgi:hypothetical protein
MLPVNGATACAGIPDRTLAREPMVGLVCRLAGAWAPHHRTGIKHRLRALKGAVRERWLH